ncbi:DUF948 domain-containing protein [Geobacter grbiciae]|uniref:DUF948 domain-containing protein n=1 Tax=Geobacter grbiciae TaxID=155042 RepID=UPI001C0296AC|nr:DUF948 domain-containing protein [Geobacter grbiciae]MBT1077057.1 DUF948 domain-containing protein [Geobacter grbiciae]
MTVTAIAVVVIALALVVLVAFIIPTLIEIRKAAADLRVFVSRTGGELKPVLLELERTLTELRTVTEGIAEKREDVQTFMEAVGDTGRNLRTINTVVSSVAHAAATSSVWITGARAAGKFLAQRLITKRG